MDSRERVLAALSHREPDRVPFDLGSTIVTGIHERAHARLRPALGLDPRPGVRIDQVQHLALVEDDLRDRLEVDAIPVFARPPAVSRGRTFSDDRDDFLYDDYGIGWRCPRDGGLYHDLCHSPLADATTAAEIDLHELPDPRDPARFAGVCEELLRARDELGLASCMWGFGGGVFETSGWLRGIEAFYMDLALEPALAERLMDRVLTIKVAWYEAVLPMIGDVLDVVCEGDDLGGQATTLVSPEMFRRLVKPRMRELFATIRARTDAAIFFHTCGAVRLLIPDLIEIGVNALNPVQVSAAGMATAELKRDFGKDVCFWGGGVDTQHVLAGGEPADVRDEVHRRIDDLAPGGGFVFAAVHNIQADVPPANILAMREALADYGTP